MHGYLDTAPCGYLRFKDNGEIVFVNATLAAWLGYTREELVGKNVEAIFTLVTRIFYNTHFFPMIRLHSSADEVYFTLLTKSGNDIPVLVNAKREKEGDIEINQCVFIRVTQRKKYEDELLKAKRDAEKALEENEVLQQLTRSLEEQSLQLDKHLTQQVQTNQNLLKLSKVISHDLREPLRKIRLYAEMLQSQQRGAVSEKGQTYLLKIAEAAERMDNLTSGMHHYLSLDNNRDRTSVNLLQTLNTATERVRSSHRAAVPQITTEGLDAVIKGYPVQLELMFYHLIDNVMKFRHPDRDPKIHVSCIELDENVFRNSKDQYKFTRHLRISFSDNARGFDIRYKDYVFEMLNKLDHGNALGIGLALVKKIVDNHNGVIKVASTTDLGTTFNIDLPVG